MEKTHMKKTTLALVLGGIISMNASAAGFFESLDTVLKGIENAAAKSAGTNGTTGTRNDSSVDDILIKYKERHFVAVNVETVYERRNGDLKGVITAKNCTNSDIAYHERQLKNSINSGDLTSSKVSATMLIGLLSNCATTELAYPEPHTKQEFIHRTGDALSNYAIISKSEEAKADAETLLNWGGTDTGQIAAMNKAFGLNTAVQDAASLSANPYTLVDMKNRNPVAFDRKYEGKIIETVGVVTKVYGNDRNVQFSLKGSNKDKDHISFSDYVVCNVTNKDEILKAENYGIGQKVKIKGIYEKEVMGSINLIECSVRPAPKKG